MTPLEADFKPVRLWGFDIQDNDQEMVIGRASPTLRRTKLNVQINKDVLTIKAEKLKKADQQEEYRNFFRRITLQTEGDQLGKPPARRTITASWSCTSRGQRDALAETDRGPGW